LTLHQRNPSPGPLDFFKTYCRFSLKQFARGAALQLTHGHHSMKRRNALGLSIATLVSGAIGVSLFSRTRAANKAQAGETPALETQSIETPELVLSEAQWREKLTAAQYRVLRDRGTERAGTSPLDQEKRVGIYHCAGCDLALFESSAKFDSGTGWPSFFHPIKNAVRTSEDRSLFSVRTEVHCRRCAGHLGHVFDDGPKPTGLRYCMNGVALKFVATTP
jgi:peptide-methionine (R)-S-oxide reductase